MEPIDYLKKIEQSGYKAFITGGYVRDLLLGIKSNDIDITTSATPNEISKIFNVPYKDELGCVNIKNSKYNIDITTFRKENNYFNRHPKNIVYIDDLLTDLKRRDFTINAICMDQNGEIVDPLNGKKDLEMQTIKVIGNIEKKFTEDPLRMLRALRLSIIYGFDIEEKAFTFILDNKHLLANISYTRKKECLEKILLSGEALKGLEMLKSTGILEALGVEFKHYRPTNDRLGVWAQLSFVEDYPFSKKERVSIENIKAIIASQTIDQHTIFKYGLNDVLIAGNILGIADHKIKEVYNNMPIKKDNELCITSTKIKSLLNIGDGPKIKIIKQDLINIILSGNLPNSEENLSKYILKKWK